MRYYLPIVFALLAFLAFSGRAVADCVPGNDQYCLLAPIPIGDNQSVLDSIKISDNIKDYIPGVVKLVIGIAGALAVIRIIIGGVQYMSSDAWYKKNDAKKTIQGAVFGLLLAMGAYIILYTLNPNLVSFNLSLEQITSSKIDSSDPNTDNTNGGAADVGCSSDCVPLIEADNNIPVSSNACSNNPCFVNSDMNGNLIFLKNALEGQVGWQVTRAFPPKTPTTTDPTCFKPGGEAGKCVDLALTVANTNITAIKTLLTNLESIFGPTKYRYKVCGQRYHDLQNSSILTAAMKQNIICNSSAEPENARVNL